MSKLHAGASPSVSNSLEKNYLSRALVYVYIVRAKFLKLENENAMPSPTSQNQNSADDKYSLQT